MKLLDFKPNLFARGLAGGHSMTIGVVTQNIGSPFYDTVTQGLISALTGNDYSPIFVDGQWKPEIELAAIRTLLNRQVDGLVLIGGKLSADTLQELVQEKPTVLVAQTLPGWEDRCINIDNVEAGFQATMFLIELGHTEIVHLAGIREHDDARDRLAGYKKALQKANIPVRQKLIVEGNFSSQSGVMAVESLMSRGLNFSAIFAANDEMAFGARLALYRRGIRVPEDISIIGFDNQPVSAYLTPPLTTVAQPALEMGATAANMILHLLNNQPFEAPKLPVQIVVRESVIQRR
jgi:LacI family transcriptional regulator